MGRTHTFASGSSDSAVMGILPGSCTMDIMSVSSLAHAPTASRSSSPQAVMLRWLSVSMRGSERIGHVGDLMARYSSPVNTCVCGWVLRGEGRVVRACTQ